MLFYVSTIHKSKYSKLLTYTNTSVVVFVPNFVKVVGVFQGRIGKG